MENQFHHNELKILEEIQKQFPSIKFSLKPYNNFASYMNVELSNGFSKDILIDIRVIPEGLEQLNLSDEDIVTFAISSLRKQITKLVDSNKIQ